MVAVRLNSSRGDGKRISVRLGKISQRNAEAIKVKMERLSANALSGHAADDDTSRWVTSLDDVLHDKLAKVGLVEARTASSVRLFVDEYVSKRSDVKASTATVWRRARNHMAAFFGDRQLRNVNVGDAKDFYGTYRASWWKTRFGVLVELRNSSSKTRSIAD